MKLLSLLELWLACHFGCVFADQPPGACSKKCHNTVQQQQDDEGGNSTSSLFPFPCSCSSSCAIYRDCCYDSPYRHEVTKKSQTKTMCLSLSGRGQFRAVSGCPSEWSQPSTFCTGSIGYLPPVTSRATGTTYANVYCAICHGDETNLWAWNVELKCCPEHDDGFLDRRYVYSKGHLWSRVSRHDKCLCRYHAHNDNFRFLQGLELRTCDVRIEVSKCPSSWSSSSNGSNDQQHECTTFLDPVYVGDKIFRNRFCAECNFNRPEEAKCVPAVVETMVSQGLGLDEIYQYCEQNSLTECLHYLSSFSRGHARPFNTLFNINEMSCMPPRGSRCCQGERYDFRSKRCKKLQQ